MSMLGSHTPSLVVGFDNKISPLDDDSLERHLRQYPPLAYDLQSRLFSYTPQIQPSHLQDFHKTFDFSRFKSSPPGYKEWYSKEMVDYRTSLKEVTCRCDECRAGRVFLDVVFGVCQMQKRETSPEKRKTKLSNCNITKPEREGFLHSGNPLNFHELDSMMFGLTLVQIRMICYKDKDGLGYLETFHFGQAPLKEMQPEPIFYVIAQVKELNGCWHDIIRQCRTFLSTLNRDVLEESEAEIDRKLVRKLFKYAQTWEQLRRVQQQQLEALQRIVPDNLKERNIWFETNRASANPGLSGLGVESKGVEEMRAVLVELTEVGEKIDVQLVKETRELIQRTNSIISIDEAYRSRDQNESIKRLSWITFIFLPLLFVSSLFGMNIDILSGDPRWDAYIWVSVPLFLMILMSVLLLKYWRSWQARLSPYLSRVKLREIKSFDLENQMTSEYGLNSERLFWAADCGDCANVEMLVKKGANINAAMKGGRTALHAAIDGGHYTVVETLLNLGANINVAEEDGRTAFQAAVAGGHHTVVETLSRMGADTKTRGVGKPTELREAADRGHQALVETLLSMGADVNEAGDGHTALQAAAGGGHQAIVKVLLDKGAYPNAIGVGGCTALQAASGEGHQAIVETLLNSGANVNVAEGGGCTALQAAAGGGHQEIVKILLSRGANVNAPPAEWNGRTALQAAAGGGYLTVVETLLNSAADVNAAGRDGCTALQAAVSGGHWTVVETLLDKGANANVVGGDGCTALQVAAQGGHQATVEKLLNKGANINALPAEWSGRTALQAAAGGGHQAIVETLLTRGADVNGPAARDYGCTALQAAAGQGHKAIVEILLKNKAEVNAPAGRCVGRTALQAAAHGGHQAVVRVLLDHGADVRAPPAKTLGLTAVGAAIEGGHQVIADLLMGMVARDSGDRTPEVESFISTVGEVL